MIGTRTVLALIPARGGSKGLPGKNIAPVAGRPLLAWTVDAARASSYVDRVVLSSDDDAIIAAALGCGCEAPFRRPAELATDTASSMDVVLHALDQLPRHDLVVLLQPTSPLRTAADIDAALERCVAQSAPACVSVVEADQSPYWMYLLGNEGYLRPLIETKSSFTRRQDLSPVYTLNGAVYVAECAWLRRTRTFLHEATVAHVMPRDRSLDIDTPQDLLAFKAAIGATSNTLLAT
jgi:CMP-N,N'-diacetyllegionaminic acid synthase